MYSIPQIRCQLNQVSHVQLEYSSSLTSYQTTTKILEVIGQSIRKQISNRFQEMKYLSTEQGIGLRKIMLQHYHRLHSRINEQHRIFNEVTLCIYQRHRSMGNSLTFIQPVVKELQHKSRVLQKQFDQIKEKLDRLGEKRSKVSLSSHLTNFPKEVELRSQSQIQKAENGFNFYEINSEQNIHHNSSHLSLFSVRKFEKLQTEAQFQQINSFLQLKMEQIQEFIKIQKQLTQKTIKKIYQIFEETLGKGLQTLEIQLLKIIRKQAKTTSQSAGFPYQSFQSDMRQSRESQIDLHCYQSLEQLLQNQKIFQKIQNVKKRLYTSSQVGEVDLTESIEKKNTSQQDQILKISPYFNYVSPLIEENQSQISNFNFKVCEKTGNFHQSIKNQEQLTPSYFPYGSFSKQNFNTINN